MNHNELIAKLGQEVFSSRRHNLEPTKPYKAVRRRMECYWNVPGSIGDGIVDVIERVEDIYQDDVRSAVFDSAVIGCMNAGYLSGNPDPDGEPTVGDADMHRWLTEPASRGEALVLFCELMGMQVPKNLQRAIDGMPEDNSDE